MTDSETIDVPFRAVKAEDALAPLPAGQVVRTLDRKEAMEQAAMAAEVYNDRFIPQVMRRAGPKGFVRFGSEGNVSIQASGVRAIKGFFGFNTQIMEGPNGKAEPWREPANAKPGDEYSWHVRVRAWSTTLNTYVDGIEGVAESHQDKKGVGRVPNAYSLGGAEPWTPRGDSSLQRAARAHAETYSFKSCCGFDDVPQWLLDKVGWTLADIGKVDFAEPGTTSTPKPAMKSAPAAAKDASAPAAAGDKAPKTETPERKEIAAILASLSDDPAEQQAILEALTHWVNDKGNIFEAHSVEELTDKAAWVNVKKARALRDLVTPDDDLEAILGRVSEAVEASRG